MDTLNGTRITTIRLIGFQTPRGITYLIFFLFLVIYCVTVCGNISIIILVSYGKSLHSPMYFFLSQLSLSDIVLVSDILPNMLSIVLMKEIAMPLSECIAQLFFFAFSESTECFLLTVMSYDRYLAICRPLHYTMIMSHRCCRIMAISSWILGICVVLIYTLTLSKLQFCGPNIVDHFFCDLNPVLELSCSDTTIVEMETTSLGTIFLIVPFFIILASYICILVTVLEIPTLTGRQKVFSTCSSHLSIVCLFYGTLFSIYFVPRGAQSKSIAKLLSLLYTVVTPLMNPLIYSLRNKDLKNVAWKLVCTLKNCS
ncbi:olfactory receptor 11L1-like [Hyperolius riggenbachi]|uniref:olfactory receptor 11L1-like n=1 Tax=Hyperolius riggenbachi TaxID=752182 RepID=UPI0035A3C77B